MRHYQAKLLVLYKFFPDYYRLSCLEVLAVIINMNMYLNFDTLDLIYGRVNFATKIKVQISRFMKDMKVLLVEKVYVVNVLGTFFPLFSTCFTFNLLYVISWFIVVFS